MQVSPHRLGGELAAPYEGMRSAHLGAYRVINRIDESAQTVYVIAIRLRGDVYGIG
jgi:mRNA-degrading endonuclease RelE of RelBE toxin-antitoxin system